MNELAAVFKDLEETGDKRMTAKLRVNVLAARLESPKLFLQERRIPPNQHGPERVRLLWKTYNGKAVTHAPDIRDLRIRTIRAVHSLIRGHKYVPLMPRRATADDGRARRFVTAKGPNTIGLSDTMFKI